MIFESLWPLFFLAAVPVIIILYLLKPKGEDREVSSHLLWQKLLKNEQSRTFFEKFVHNILMYLQILITALLVIALMAPFFLADGRGGGREILLLDTSGSMQHIGSSGKSRFEEAVERACDFVRDAEDTRFSVVTVDAAGAELLAVDIADADSLVRLLRGLECSDGGSALTAAQGILDNLIGSEDEEIPGLTVYTDGAGAEEFGALRFNGSRSLVAAGDATANVANEYTVHTRREDGLWDVLTGLVNYSAESVTLDVSLYDEDGKVLALQQMKLAPEESAVCLFDGVDWKGSILRTEISGMSFSGGRRDSLAADNVSYAVKERENLINGLLVGRGNLFLERAYQAVTGESISKAESDRAVEGEAYNVVIYDAGAGPETGLTDTPDAAANRLIFGNAFDSAEETLQNVVLTVRECALTTGLGEFTVGVNNACCFALPEGAESFLECGGKCVGYYREVDGHKEIVAGFDIRESDFPLMAEFPIFLANVMTYLSDTSWLASHTFYAGDTITLQPWAEMDRDRFENCQDKAGVYQVGNEEYRESYVVRFQTATESDGQREAASVDTEGGAGGQRAKRTLRNLFLLLAILALAAEWVIYVRQMRYRGRFYAFVRGMVLFCALLALFGVQMRVRSRQTATVFVVDLSDSNKGNLEEMSAYLRRTIAEMPARNSYGIVTFGQNTLVEQFVTSEKHFGGLMTLPEKSATDFEQALSAALTMIPADSGGRLVLLTDGKQTRGDIQRTARALTAGGTEFLTLLYGSEEAADTYIEKVDLPGYLHPGDAYSVTVLVESNYDTEAELILYNGSRQAQSSQVHLNVGSNRFVFRQQAGESESGSGAENLRVQVRAQGDTCEENDSFSAYSVVEAPPRTLLISGMRADTFAFSNLLSAAGIDYSVVSAFNAPEDIDAMLEYKCIILADTYLDDLPTGFLANLETYVRDYGCGFVCCGGEDSFALGGYRDSVLERVLPVDMELRGVDEVPSMAMVMVIDHSGSMLSEADSAGMSNLDIAIKAATVAVDNLRSSDQVGVLTFDDSYSWQVEITEVGDRSTIKEKIKTINEGGGTTIKPALREAFRAISDSDVSIRHVVLLTDGMGETTDFRDVTGDYSGSGITLSTVAVGEDSDTRLLEHLAKECGGRYYYSDLSSDIPRIFAQEVFLRGDSYIQNGEISLAVNGGHELTAGLFAQGWPCVYGYICATPKTTSRALITSAEKGDPILTVWQYGLGRTVAWNSDITGEWTGAFSGREDYVQLWKRIVDYAAGNANMGEDRVDVVTTGETAKITYQTEEYGGSTEVFATMVDPEGVAEEVRLHAVAPGRYEAEIPTSETGLYHFNIRRTDGGEISNYMTTAAAVQFSDEYKFDASTAACIRFVEQYGRLITPEETIWKTVSAQTGERRSLANLLLVLTILFFLADVAMRRFQYVPKLAGAGIKLPGRRDADRQAGAQEAEQAKAPQRGAEQGKAAQGEAEQGKAAQGQTDRDTAKQQKTGQTRQKEKRRKQEDQTLDTSQLLRKKEDRTGK